MSQYFPKPYEPFNGDFNVKVDFSNYATKTDIKNIAHIDTSSFALKSNLAGLKTEVDKLDIDKLVPVPVDLSKLSDVVEKTAYEELVAKVNSIDTSAFVLKTDKSELENKTPDTSGLVKKTDYNTKIYEIDNKIPSISNLATTTTLTTVKNKILSFSNLVKKQTMKQKLLKLKRNLLFIIMTNMLLLQSLKAADIFNARLAQANLVAKTNLDNIVSSLDSKIAANKAKNESIENEFKKSKNI